LSFFSRSLSDGPANPLLADLIAFGRFVLSFSLIDEVSALVPF
jgi:hypothetical protein